MATRRKHKYSPRREVSARTLKRRARQAAERSTGQEAKKKDETVHPETLAQARVWERKFRRYQLIGLCDVCAAQAAWGHACGFGKVRNPCDACQPLVDQLPDSGPRGSKWRKCLIRLEVLPEEEVKELLEA